MAVEHDKSKPGLARRELLQLGAAGVTAALGVGGSDARLRARTGSGGQVPVTPAPPPPDIDDIVDPRRLPGETWAEPWIWRPEEWSGQALDLNVVGGQDVGAQLPVGHRFGQLFSFNGGSPGPTIRVRGDGVVRVKLRNLLPMNAGKTPVGPTPDVVELPPDVLQRVVCRVNEAMGRACGARPPGFLNLIRHFELFFEEVPVTLHDSACMSAGVNLQHATHVTNIHTHGLHVEPGINPDGTVGDNIFVRVLPRGDWKARQAADDPACRELGSNERVAEVDYTYRLGDVMRARRRRDGGAPMPQPPGTHWYHPHAHGATHDQVSNGMAGFFVLEGDVDDAINVAMTGEERPDPQQKTGPFDYRERQMLIQRVEVAPVDFEAGPRRGLQAKVPAPTAVNGALEAGVILMRPGAVERWRVLNGSVDGRGFKSFMVLEGQFVHDQNGLFRVETEDTADGTTRRLVPATRDDVERAKRRLYQLAFDGITLVAVENGRARYALKDLSRQNPGRPNPLARPPEALESEHAAMLRNVEQCFRDGPSLRDAFVRPNEVYLANGNRTDVLFQAPLDAAGKVFTVLSQEVVLHTDNFQQRLQISLSQDRTNEQDLFNPAPADEVVAYIRVEDEPVPGGEFDVMRLNERLPDVPPFLQPVRDDELRVPAAEASQRGVAAGSYRTRVVSYSGLGGAEFPHIEVPDAFAEAHPELEMLVWAEYEGTRLLLPPLARTMAVNSRFDLARHPEPPAARKFVHDDPEHIRAKAESAEEWVLYNNSMALWSQTNKADMAIPGLYRRHYPGVPLARADGQARHARDPEFQITSKGVDHPFHIHINPCWVTRIEIPDEQGRLHNVLDAPRWMDVIPIPRDGGRVVFRTRFVDFVGTWIHHCHVLLHEDNGMMETVEATENAADTNYAARDRVASHDMRSEDVSSIYPRPSREIMYRQNLEFVDAGETGQVYPGFAVEVPTLED